MSGFGFLSPLLFGLSALAIPIFLLYMLRLRRTEVSISSTFLWQQLIRDREANAPWQKLRPNWLMFLQLLILAALVIALARPFTEVTTIITGRTVVLLDASASMNATDVDGDKSRFEEAKDLALDTIATLGSDDTMTVIRVAEIPEVLVAASRDKSVLRDAIRDAEPSTASADWVAAFTLAAAGGQGVDNLRVVALSDGGIPVNVPEIEGDFSYVKVGESARNVAITALSTRALPNEPPQLFASLTNYGDEQTSTILAIELDGNLETAHQYTIGAGQTVEIIEEDLPFEFQTLKASLTTPRDVDTPDYLEADNVAYAVFSQPVGGNVLVMTEQNIFLERIFSSLPGAELTMRDPADGLPSGEYDLYVFDSWLPNSLPEGDLLIIDPPGSNALFDVIGETTNTRVNADTGGTDPSDSRTRYLDFRNVNVRQMRTVDGLEWADTLVETADGLPLVFAGEQDGHQIAGITFDLHESDLPIQIAWPILISSLMEWYQPQRAITVGDSVPPGTPITIRPAIDADNVRITAPDGNRVTLSLEETAQVIYGETEQLGLYQIEVRRDDDVVQQDAFAVNLFAEEESNIAPAEELEVQTREGNILIGSGQGEEVGRREWWPYLAYLGLMLLAIEWWYYHRSKNRIRQATAHVTYLDEIGQKKRVPWWQFWSRLRGASQSRSR